MELNSFNNQMPIENIIQKLAHDPQLFINAQESTLNKQECLVKSLQKIQAQIILLKLKQKQAQQNLSIVYEMKPLTIHENSETKQYTEIYKFYKDNRNIIQSEYLKTSLVELNASFWKKTAQVIKHSLEEANAANIKNYKRLKKNSRMIAAQRQQLEQKTTDIRNKDQLIQRNLERIRALENELEQKNLQNIRCQEKISSLKTIIENSLQTLTQQVSEQSRLKLEREIMLLNRNKRLRDYELAEKIERLQSLSAKICINEARINQIKNILSEQAAKLEKIKNECLIIQHDKQTLTQDNNIIQNTFRENQESLQRLVSQKQNLQNQISRLSVQHQSGLERVDQIKLKVRQQQQILSHRLSQLQQAENKLEEYLQRENEKISSIQRLNQRVQDLQNQTETIKRIGQEYVDRYYKEKYERLQNIHTQQSSQLRQLINGLLASRQPFNQ